MRVREATRVTEIHRFGKLEDLQMQPGGAKGDQWVIVSGERPLTNVCPHSNPHVAARHARIDKKLCRHSSAACVNLR